MISKNKLSNLNGKVNA